MHSYDVKTGKVINFCNKVNEFFPLLSRSNKMADLIVVICILNANAKSFHKQRMRSRTSVVWPLEMTSKFLQIFGVEIKSEPHPTHIIELSI